MGSINYISTFIEVAEDCPATSAEIPPCNEDKKTIAYMQYEMIFNEPYRYSSDDVLFHIHAVKKKIATDCLEEERNNFFSKGQPCMRSSPLAKRYGWGIHSNSQGKIAIYPVDSLEYQKYRSDASVVRMKALKSKK